VKMKFLTVLILMQAIKIFTVRAETLDVKAGMLRSPTATECGQADGQSFVKTWTFLLFSKSSSLYLTFPSFRLTDCSKEYLVIESTKIEVFCENTKPCSSLYTRHSVNVTYVSNTKLCQGLFSVYFNIIDLVLKVSDSHVITGQKLDYSVTLTNLPEARPTFSCALYFGDQSHVILSTYYAAVQHAYTLPGKRHIICHCSTDIQPMEFMSASMEVSVESILTKRSLALYFDSLKFSFGGPITITLRHKYLFPILYQLRIGTVVLSEDTGNFNAKKYISKSEHQTQFTLDQAAIERLGPGDHRLVLDLINSVSSLRHETEIIITKALVGLQVSTNPFVGVWPYNFTANITILEGAPARITTDVLTYPANALVGTVDTMCFNAFQCHSSKVETSVSTSMQQYQLRVTAVNDLSTVTFISDSFRAAPKIIDIKIVLRTQHIASGIPASIDFYVRGNPGKYQLCYAYEGKSIESKLVLSENAPTNEVYPNVPFDSTQYHRLEKKITFSDGGYHVLTVSVKNKVQQSFYFKKSFQVKRSSSCLSVDIDDGRKFESNFAIQISSNFAIGTNVEITCNEYSEVKYLWKAYKTTSNLDEPSPDNLVALNGKVSNPEIVLMPGDYEPGFYAITLAVTVHAFNGDVIEREEDLTRIEIIRPTAEAKIKGGVRREIGNFSEVLLEATVVTKTANIILSYQWLCATSKDDLPDDPELGRINRKGSCFGTNPLSIGIGNPLKVTKFEPSSHYFIRLFVSGSNLNTAYTDQKIVTLSSQHPQLDLQCLSNCHWKVASQRAIILQAECSECVRHTWALNSEVYTLCEDQSTCKIPVARIAASRSGTQTIETTVILTPGVNSLGNQATAMYNFEIKTAPSDGSCNISPTTGTAFVTMFTVKCQGFLESTDRIKYKFTVKTKKLGEYLAQSGYDNTLEDVTLPKGDLPHNEVAILVDVCDGESCSRYTLKAEVVKSTAVSTVPFALFAEIDNALKSKNLENLVQLVVPVSSTDVITATKRNTIISAMKDADVVSVEKSQQISDLLDHVTNHPSDISSDSSDIAWNKLSEVKDFVEDLSSEADIAPIVTSSVGTIANLMQSPNFTKSKVEETSQINEFGRLMLNEIAPGDPPMSFETSATKTTLMKLNSNSMDRLRNVYAEVQVPDLSPSADVLNLEIDKYNTKKINFDTGDRSVDHVTAISLTEGIEDPDPILSGNFRSVPIKFQVSRKPSGSQITLAPTPDCNATLCKDMTGTVTHHKQSSGPENLQAAFVIVDVKAANANTTKIKIVVSDEASENFTISKIFHDWQATWPISYPVIPIHVKKLRISVTVSFAEPLNIQSEPVTVQLAVYLVNCMYWDDFVNNWNDIGCKPNVSRELPNVMCECNASEPTKIGRSGGITKKPALFASRLIVYPHSIAYDELSWNLWTEFMENPIIGGVLVTLFSTYFTLLWFAFKSDQNMLTEKSYINVSSNSKSDNYRYFVTIYTGNAPKAGSSGIVAFTLFGSDGMGKPHVLQKRGETVFTRSSVRSFLIKSKESLGAIIAISVLRCRDENTRKWYLQRMVVRDLETDHCCFFLCNCWIGEDEEHFFRVAVAQELQSFSQLFRLASENFCRDRHTWLTVPGMRPWHQYIMTRVQRLTVCYHLVFLLALTTLMFYDKSSEDQAFVLQAGTLSVSWSTIAIGLESGLLCLPMTVLVTSLFRL
uniref:Uncharacterized LOC100185837 n=1 Tax=Ciona intestinalis TaxID=7719 RepID=H2XP11_CIOIN